jgi:hypothetical protein
LFDFIVQDRDFQVRITALGLLKELVEQDDMSAITKAPLLNLALIRDFFRLTISHRLQPVLKLVCSRLLHQQLLWCICLAVNKAIRQLLGGFSRVVLLYFFLSSCCV